MYFELYHLKFDLTTHRKLHCTRLFSLNTTYFVQLAAIIKIKTQNKTYSHIQTQKEQHLPRYSAENVHFSQPASREAVVFHQHFQFLKFESERGDVTSVMLCGVRLFITPGGAEMLGGTSETKYF